MAAAGPIDIPKADWLLECVCNKKLKDFVDGDCDAKDFINAILEKKSKITLVGKCLQVIDNFKNNQGLNPGDNFFIWMQNLLKQKGIEHLKDLIELRKKGVSENNQLKNRITQKPITNESMFSEISIIASDVTTQSKIIFPKMAELFYSDPDSVSPANFIRASMSFPFFFEPFKIKKIPSDANAWNKWNKYTGLVGSVPSEVLLIDGGILSNFPIDKFHLEDQIPQAPTFGIKIDVDKSESNKNDTLFHYIQSIINTTCAAHDDDFLRHNPDFNKLIGYIDVGDHKCLNFNISDKDKIDLFVRGAKAAANFLHNFDWKNYKKIREVKSQLYKQKQATNSILV